MDAGPNSPAEIEFVRAIDVSVVGYGSEGAAWDTVVKGRCGLR